LLHYFVPSVTVFSLSIIVHYKFQRKYKSSLCVPIILRHV
jgi:hypothetical protein